MLLTLAVESLCPALDESSVARKGPQQMRGFFERSVVRLGDENGVAPSRHDLDWRAVAVYLLDQRKQVLVRLTPRDRHGPPLSRTGYRTVVRALEPAARPCEAVG